MHVQKRSPHLICIKFCRLVDIPDVITLADFGDDQLSGLGVVGGQISSFPVGFRCRPYNTLALPCECVIKPMILLYASALE